jgi:DHA2 family multidrug resistance protein
MSFMFSTKVDNNDMIIPLLLQGLGAGMLMVPIILFVITSSPAKYGTTGSGIGIFVRFSGFCTSIALINYFQLYAQGNHINRFQEQLSDLDPAAVQRLAAYKQSFIAKGVAPDQAAKIATGLLNRSINAQAQLRFDMDYYQMISWLLLGVILVIALFPSINRTINLRSNQPAPVIY